MGDNFLVQQVKNHRKRRDLALREIQMPSLFLRPDVLSTSFTVKPVSGERFAEGEALLLLLDEANPCPVIARGHVKVGEMDGDGAKVLYNSLIHPRGMAFFPIIVKEVGPISGFAKIEIGSGGLPHANLP